MAQVPNDKDKTVNESIAADLESVEQALKGLQQELQLQEANSTKLAQAQDDIKTAQADIKATQAKQGTSIALREKLLKITAIFATIALLAALGAGYGVVQTRAQNRAIAKDRLVRSIASCNQYNDQVTRAIDGDVAQAVGLIYVADAVNATQHLPPTDPATAKLFIDQERLQSEKVNPYRDCSEAGINAYLAQKTAKIECASDGKGFCKISTPTTVPPKK